MKIIIPFLIVGVLVLSGLGAGAISQKNNNIVSFQHDKNPTISYEDDLDQSMITVDSALQAGWYHPNPGQFYNLTLAQSFIPQKEVLTRVQFLMARNETTTYPCTLAIRDNLTGENLAMASVEPSAFPVYNPQTLNLAWIEFDINDIWLTSGQTYYIVIYTKNITNNCYWCGGNGSNLYPNGSAFYSMDNGNTWSEFPDGDGCFKTYGLEETFLQVTSTPGVISSYKIRNIGNVTAWDVEISLSIKGGIFGRINKTDVKTIGSLLVDQEVLISISPGMVFGFGPIEITLKIHGANVREISTTANGIIIFFFIIIR
jgi:hypothetical protein